MPMSFPLMEHLKATAEVHEFRQPNPDETELHYRNCLADFIEPIDLIESHEIRTGKGWDQWTDAEKEALLKRRLGS